MSVRAVSLMIATLLMCSAAGSVAAHHSYAMFDMQREVRVEGTVKDYQWTNPHIWIQVLGKDASGQAAEWAIEGNSPGSLARLGWSRKTLKAGDKISVVIHPLKTSSDPGGSLVSVVIGGQTLSGSGGGARTEGAR